MSENVNFIQGRKEQYNPSEMQGGLFFSKDSKEILLNGESYGNATPADEEDITAEDGNLKLKDRAYDEANFSGKGYKILRKNIQQVTVPKFNLTISTGCTANGNITINEISIEVTTEASTPEAVAQLIQSAISGTTISGAVVTFTSNPTINYSTTGVSGQVVDNSYQENRNILTQDMINEPNTIYEIRYDFDLNGATITIPEGCVLKFEGGSLDNGTLNGTYTSIDGNESIFLCNLTISGTFKLTYVLINWFKRNEAYQMFSDAASFAKQCMQNIQQAWQTPSLVLKCICSTYTINDTIRIPTQVSLDGCGSTFVPSNQLENKYMFFCNISPEDETTWEQGYPGNVKDFISNFHYSNPSSILTHLIKCGDSRRIQNIQVFRPARLITYTGNYIDNKFISEVAGNMENTNFPLNATSTDTLRQTSKISIGLGDDCVIQHISDGCSIFIGGGANAHINGAINLTISISGSRNIFIENIHNESGIIYLAESSAILKNCYFYAKDDGNIKQFVPYNKYSEIILENCYFGNLQNLSTYQKGYSPIQDTIKASFINCFALDNDGGGGHNSGNAVPILYQNRYVNPIRYQVNLKTVLEDYVHLSLNDANDICLYYPETTGGDTHIRLLLLADPERQLYFYTKNYNSDIQVTLPVYINDYSWDSSKTQLTNAVLRIEIGSSEQYTHYFDVSLIYKKKERLQISYNNTTYYLDSHSFSEIDYESNYIPVIEYTRHENNIEALLDSDILPDVSLLTDGDRIITKSNSQYLVKNSRYIY